MEKREEKGETRRMGRNTHIFILADYIDLHLTTAENRINRNGNTRGFSILKERKKEIVSECVCVLVFV